MTGVQTCALPILCVVVAFAALARHAGAMLLGPAPAGDPSLAVPASAAVPIVAGLVGCLVLGTTAGPVVDLLHAAARIVAGTT